jgi:mRNA-degrading endonuclease YafQ of YafQ-DinJ toxin-antitoxin module
MVHVEYTSLYQKGLQKILAGNPIIQSVVERHIRLFRTNPADTRLADHVLHKRLAGRRAFSVTDDIRIVYRWTSKTTVQFLAIGTHKDVYRKN